jgi:hypothetical protein
VHLCNCIDESSSCVSEIVLWKFVIIDVIEENKVGFLLNRGGNEGGSTAATPPQSFALAAVDQPHGHINVVQPFANCSLSKIYHRGLVEAASVSIPNRCICADRCRQLPQKFFIDRKGKSFTWKQFFEKAAVGVLSQFFSKHIIEVSRNGHPFR